MKYIELTQNKYAIIDDDMVESIGRYRWFFHFGYAFRHVQENGKGRTIPMHREILNTPNGLEVDHINGNRLDNRKENLRNCTKHENMRNREASKSNSSGFKGVIFQKGRYVARIGFGGKLYHLGRFSTAEEASEAYKNACEKFHGDFANVRLHNPNKNEVIILDEKDIIKRPITIRTNSSGYIGVVFEKSRQLFAAKIKTKGRTYFLGRFKTAELAGAAYNKKAKEFWGEKAILNIIPE